MIPAVERFEIAFKRRRRYHRLTAEGGITFDIKIGFHERRCLLEALIVEQDRDRVNESSYVRKTKLSKSSLLQLLTFESGPRYGTISRKSVHLCKVLIGGQVTRDRSYNAEQLITRRRKRVHRIDDLLVELDTCDFLHPQLLYSFGPARQEIIERGGRRRLAIAQLITGVSSMSDFRSLRRSLLPETPVSFLAAVSHVEVCRTPNGPGARVALHADPDPQDQCGCSQCSTPEEPACRRRPFRRSLLQTYSGSLFRRFLR